MVAIVEKRLGVVCELLPLFLDVNDPYVVERVLAVAYGCAMRTADEAGLQRLATQVYDLIFDKGLPPVHILARDYARGVIECAIARGVPLAIALDKIRPPYGSCFPEVPLEDELKKFRQSHEGMAEEEWARISLYDSVMEYGDFARYIIGTNSNYPPWSSLKLTDPVPPTPTQLYQSFIASLSRTQQRAFENYRKIAGPISIDALRAMLTAKGDGAALDLSSRQSEISRADETTADEFDVRVREAEKTFTKLLRAEQRADFETKAKPYIQNPNKGRYQEQFDLSIAQRCILNKVFELGWTSERFGRFDRRAGHGRMTDGTIERIGEKYQWIAYHEFLARLADNFRFVGYSSNDENRYDGPWQLATRDIDPSFLLPQTRGQSMPPQSHTWWNPLEYKSWCLDVEEIEWLRRKTDLPNVRKLLEVVTPQDRTDWILLDGTFWWREPYDADEDYIYHRPKRAIYYFVKSYIIRSNQQTKFLDWAYKQNFMGRWMPELNHLNDVFLGEAFWAPSTADQSFDGWIRERRDKVPVAMRPTAMDYFWEGGGDDKSIDGHMRISLPAPWLWREMKLSWRAREGCFFDGEGRLVAFDPSVRESGPTVLLVAKRAILELLKERGLSLVWTIIGEKLIITSTVAGSPGRLEASGAYLLRDDGIHGRLSGP
jgi:hypothetical protein